MMVSSPFRLENEFQSLASLPRPILTISRNAAGAPRSLPDLRHSLPFAIASDCLPRKACRREKAVPPEKENCRRLLIDLEPLGKRHASYVFLVSPYVFKVKKKVNFGFLDFSSLKNRLYYSEREVTLNRRLCPDIYLGVIPISLSAGKLTFGKGEKVVECAVKMRKLQDRYFMLRLLRHDQFKTKDLDRIVSKLRNFYEAETPTQKITKWGSHSRVPDTALLELGAIPVRRSAWNDDLSKLLLAPEQNEDALAFSDSPAILNKGPIARTTSDATCTRGREPCAAA